jgi:hypothetical protein
VVVVTAYTAATRKPIDSETAGDSRTADGGGEDAMARSWSTRRKPYVKE